MNGNDIQKAFKKIKALKFNQNLLIFGFFLLISSLFWFFNALNNEYSTEINIPVEYVRFPDNKLVAEGQSNEVKVKITALGYRVMNYKTSAIKPVLINLKLHKPQIVEGTKSKKFYINTQTIINEITNVIGRDLDIKIIGPDSLIFTMDEVISKLLPVRKNFEISFKKQFMLKDNIKIWPDSIRVKGEKSMLDTLSEVLTVHEKYKDISSSLSLGIDLIKIPGTEFSSKKVSFIAEVEEYTEMSYELPIEVINAPEKIQIKIFPANAKVTFNIGFSRFQSLYKEQFRLICDYKETKGSQFSQIRVKIAKSPDHIAFIRINPSSVDYIIENND